CFPIEITNTSEKFAIIGVRKAEKVTKRKAEIQRIGVAETKQRIKAERRLIGIADKRRGRKETFLKCGKVE
ncbi:MAG: hypothetical protein ACOC7K_01050, partial [bacterium]